MTEPFKDPTASADVKATVREALRLLDRWTWKDMQEARKILEKLVDGWPR